MAEVQVFKLYLLVLMRFAGLVVSAPTLGSGNLPPQFKVGLAAFTALLVTPVLPAMTDDLPVHPLAFGLMAGGEFLIGLMIGFVMMLVFAAIQVGGQIMDMQTGFGMMNVFNPALETQFPIFGFFLFILAVLQLLLINGHHEMLRAVVHTYEVIPLGELSVRPAVLLEVSRWGRAMFLDGLMIAAPIAAAMLLAYVSMGIMGRVVPQIHLFVVGFPITIALGLLITGLSLQYFLFLLGGDTRSGLFGDMFRNVDTLIRGLS